MVMERMRLALLATATLLALTAASCAKKEASLLEAPAVAPSLAERGAAVDSFAALVPMRKLIVTHALTVEVGSVDEAIRVLLSLGEGAGGYSTGCSRQRRPDGSFTGQVSLRLPPKTVGALLGRARALGKVLGENSTTEDVTEGYVDLEARLRVAKASEGRLLELLSRKAQKLSEVLEAERELTRVRGDIESMEARKRSWDLLTQLVTVVVDLAEPERGLPALHRVWTPVKTALGDGLVQFAQSLHGAIVFLGAAVPWVVILGGGLWGLRRLVRRKGSR
jgi:hypothetical protein